MSLASMKVWWAGRTVREQWMLRGLAAVLAAVVAWYGVLTPLQAWRAAAAERRQEAARELAEVNAGIQALRQSKPSAAGGQDVSAVVESSAASAGIVISRRREAEDARLTVWIDAVPSRTLMQWLLLLRQSHGVAVSELAASTTEGGLQAEVTFAGAGR
ncbi:MAG TPA: type II secretion system protein GspM [Caulobacteraceae bacterium]|nr:type II secretion system protein GspM [Caulobacteraceae bacterium]